MNFSDKIVTAMPLVNIWTTNNELKSQRVAYLTKDDIKNILKQGPVNFIVADVGHKLIWIDPSQCYDFWKSEVQIHVATDLRNIYLDNFVDNYAYVASKWNADDPTPIILLEKRH